MGTFDHEIRLFGAGREETLEALVDTGATFTVVPAPVLRRLGVEPFDTLPVVLADGRREVWQLGEIDAQINGRRRPILCLFGPDDAHPLIGAHALEAFLLMVNPVERKLVSKDA